LETTRLNEPHENKNIDMDTAIPSNNQQRICTKQRIRNTGSTQRQEGTDIETEKLYIVF
jgi:hypothetical protein